MHRAAAFLEYAEESLRAARPELKRLTIARDFRRGCELIGDMSIVAERSAPAGAVVQSGGLQVRVADPRHLGATLLQATGSAAHLDGLRALAEKKGMCLEPDGPRDAAWWPRRKRTSIARSASPSSSRSCGRGVAKSSGR